MLKKMILITLTVLFLLSVIVACSGPTPIPEVVEVDAEALILERCSVCHSTDRVFQANYNESGWSDLIDRMIGKGADVNAEEKQLMLEWLISRD